MNIKCDLKELINALNIVSKTSSSKTTMPILEGVLFEAYQNKLKLITNDLEIGCEHTFPCEVIREGKTVVDLKMLNEIVRKIEDETIEISVDENLFVLKSVNGVFKLAVMNPNEYPKLPVFDIENSIQLEQSVFKDMIRRTLFSVSTDENRPVYNGALVKVEDRVLTIVTIDGFRLSLRKHLSDRDINDFKAIIPGRVLSELLKILSDSEDESVRIGVNRNQALFEIGNSIIISRLIEGEFLNYKSIIPEHCETKVRVKTKKLLDSFERVALFAKENKEKDKKSPVKMKLSLDGITLSCVSENGDEKEYHIDVIREEEKIYFDKIEIKDYDLKFNKDIHEYNLKIDNSTNKLDIKVYPSDISHKILNNENLTDGSKITIQILEDNNNLEYTINISKDNHLVNIISLGVFILGIVLLILSVIRLIIKKMNK